MSNCATCGADLTGRPTWSIGNPVDGGRVICHACNRRESGRGRPLLHDTLLPPGDWRGLNRHSLRLDEEEVGVYDGTPGIPYAAEWVSEAMDRFLRVTLPGGRVVEVCAIAMGIGPGPWPIKPEKKRKRKPEPEAPRAQEELMLL